MGGSPAFGYLCGRCERQVVRLNRVLSVEQVGPAEVLIKHTCFCTEDDCSTILQGRYVLVPDLMYRLFKQRMIRLPYYAPPRRRRVTWDHPDLVEMRAELEDVRTLDDMFPPG